METLLLVDSHALIHRFFHALPPLNTPSGQPISAIYGLANIVLKIFREQKPDYIAATFDRPEKTFREEIFKEYKATRKKAVPELISQFKLARELFDKFKIPVVEMPGYEADDLIGSLVEKFRKEKDLKIIIVSGDLDLLQLVEDEKVVVQFLKKGLSDTVLYDEKAVAARYGLKPDRLPDLKGFLGDVSDNIPGVKGVGEKTAIPLLQKYDTVEGVYEHLWEIPEKIGSKLEAGKESALFSRQLATIKRDVSMLVQELDDLKLEEFDKNKIIKYFESLGFYSLVKRLE